MRTRTLIQIGGLAEKSGLLRAIGVVDGLDLQSGGPDAANSAATIFGAMLEMVETLSSEHGTAQRAAWRARGAAVFRKDSK